VGSPWAIGRGAKGGTRTSIHVWERLGDFKRASHEKQVRSEVALDLAYSAAPDHLTWKVTQGMVRSAPTVRWQILPKNPPKRNRNFPPHLETEQRSSAVGRSCGSGVIYGSAGRSHITSRLTAYQPSTFGEWLITDIKRRIPMCCSSRSLLRAQGDVPVGPKLGFSLSPTPTCLENAKAENTGILIELTQLPVRRILLATISWTQTRRTSRDFIQHGGLPGSDEDGPRRYARRRLRDLMGLRL